MMQRSFADHPSFLVVSRDGEPYRYAVGVHEWGWCCREGHDSRTGAVLHAQMELARLLDLDWQEALMQCGSLAREIEGLAPIPKEPRAEKRGRRRG